MSSSGRSSGRSLDTRPRQAPAEPAAYSVQEVARLLSCSRRHVYDHLIAGGRVRTLKVGRRVLIPAHEVQALLEEAR